jgi:hypothetical protein
MFMRARSSLITTDAAPLDAAVDTALDAIEPDATVVELDAASAITTDAGPRITRPDAAGTTPPVADAAPVVVKGTATLKVGANPWGEVLVDGTPRGRTPLELTLPAGRHVVEVVFKGEDPPRTSKKTIDLKPNETETVEADFTKP